MTNAFKQTTRPREFLKPEMLLQAVPVGPGMSVADFGSGNGYYTVACGILVGPKGQVFALDIMEDALSQTASLAKMVGLHNVSTIQCDLEKFHCSTLQDTVCDLVIISSLLHQLKNRGETLREAYRILKTGGKVLVVEWDRGALFGPPVAERLLKDEVKKLLEQYSFRPVKELPAGSFHYALLYSK